jgi:hypothetical protein
VKWLEMSSHFTGSKFHNSPERAKLTSICSAFLIAGKGAKMTKKESANPFIFGPLLIPFKLLNKGQKMTNFQKIKK